MGRKARVIKKTILRTKGKNCDNTKRKQLSSIDKEEMREHLLMGRYLAACKIKGIKPDPDNPRIQSKLATLLIRKARA